MDFSNVDIKREGNKLIVSLPSEADAQKFEGFINLAKTFLPLIKSRFAQPPPEPESQS